MQIRIEHASHPRHRADVPVQEAGLPFEHDAWPGKVQA